MELGWAAGLGDRLHIPSYFHLMGGTKQKLPQTGQEPLQGMEHPLGLALFG